MFTMLAGRYRDEPYVVAFDLFGEPGNDIGPGIYDPPGKNWLTWDCGTCRKVMGVLFDKDKLYERTINAIHSVSNKLVILEGFAYDFRYIKNAGDKMRSTVQRPNSDNFAIGQSVYEWFKFEWLDGNKGVADSWNVPFLATEFGVESSDVDSPAPDKVAWVEQACQEFASRGMGWFYWGFGPGKGDFNLVDETDKSQSPILTLVLPTYASKLTGLPPR
jgi:hypothetical protein